MKRCHRTTKRRGHACGQGTGGSKLRPTKTHMGGGALSQTRILSVRCTCPKRLQLTITCGGVSRRQCQQVDPLHYCLSCLSSLETGTEAVMQKLSNLNTISVIHGHITSSSQCIYTISNRPPSSSRVPSSGERRASLRCNRRRRGTPRPRPTPPPPPCRRLPPPRRRRRRSTR